MLQINNSLYGLAEAKHSLKEIMKSAMDLPALSRVNTDNNTDVPQRSRLELRK
jgi:hypothetical protein